jgi:monoterpene epsilon-lactone hydrolase
LLQNGFSANKIIAAGDSAGGNLTLALLIALRDSNKLLPAGLGVTLRVTLQFFQSCIRST